MQSYGNKLEQKLRMPELNLDVLNIMTKRDYKRQQADATKLRMHRHILQVTDQKSKKLLEYLDSENSADSNKDNQMQDKAQDDEDQRSKLNAFLLDKMLIRKLEAMKIKFNVTEQNRNEICSQVSTMVSEIISGFDSFKIMAKNNFKFDFDHFLMKYDQHMRIKEKQKLKGPESLRNRETIMLETLEKESTHYDQYFKTLDDIKIRYTQVDRIRLENIERIDWIKQQQNKVRDWRVEVY